MMKKLSTNGVKILKICHLLFVMMWVIGVVAMALIYFTFPKSGDELYSAFYIMRLIDDALVIPGAVLTVITAIIYGKYTNWGFFKHNWIIVKWILAIIIIIAGTFVFSPWLDSCLEIADIQRDAALTNSFINAYFPLIAIFATIQSAGLVFLVVISVIKPWKKKNFKIK